MNVRTQHPRIVETNAADFAADVLASTQPVLVTFFAAWSHPCHILDSVLNQVATACVGSAKVVRIDADNNPDLSLCYGVQSIPTLLYFLGGRVRDSIVGTASKEAILAKLQTVLSDDATRTKSSVASSLPNHHES